MLGDRRNTRAIHLLGLEFESDWDGWGPLMFLFWIVYNTLLAIGLVIVVKYVTMFTGLKWLPALGLVLFIPHYLGAIFGSDDSN